jgi:integrase
MVSLSQDSKGNYRARKRLPDDVRDDYGRLYGPSSEAKFSRKADTKPHVERREFNEWLSDVEARIANIRAQRNGEGQVLTRQQTRALAGEWYEWFLARHSSSERNWDQARDKVQDAMREVVGARRWEQNHPDELWEQDEELKAAVRPVLADVGETAQFLATKALVLTNDARDQFLDHLYKDLAEALRRLIRLSEGDYSPDKYRERFPKLEGGNTGQTPTQLFARWVTERQPSANSIESWRYVFREMEKHFENRSAASLTTEEAQNWVRSLVKNPPSAQTVRRTYISASRTVFGWAVEHKHIAHNSFKQAKITVPKQRKNRETQAFRPEEYRVILKASLAIAKTSTAFEAAKRWVPWLLAYTGARPSEITQLRKQDVIEQDGIHALLLTPEAGSMKNNRARVVPLHEHVLAQGFLEFAQSHSDGPLFHTGKTKVKRDNPVSVSKSQAAQVRQRLAAWIRSLGVTDRELSPNHAWRHTFKQIADRYEISERVSDAITGHAPATIGRGYGAPTLSDMAKALEKFPRYEW